MAASSMAHSNRLALWIAHHLSLQEGGLWRLEYPVALGLARGDWFEVARDYRSWAIQQPWCRKGRRRERTLPALTTSYGLWLSHWAGPKATVAPARELQRLVNAPVKLDWHCWHECAKDGAYPDYFPPREGEEALSVARHHLSEAGVLTQLSLNALLASPQSRAWQEDQAEQYALRSSQRVALSSAAGPNSSSLTPMCPATDYWHQKLTGLARQAVQHGADGIFLEQLAASDPLLCEHPDH